MLDASPGFADTRRCGCALRCHAAVAVALVLGALAKGEGGATTPALDRAREARSAARIRTVFVDGVERIYDKNGASVARFFTWRAAGDDRIRVDHGDENGLLTVHLENPELDVTDPDLWLQKGGELWHRNAVQSNVDVMPSTEALVPVADFRQAGLDPTSLRESGYAKRFQEAGLKLNYSETRDGDLYKVSAEYEQGGRLTWWIDPARDWYVVRSRSEMKGRVIVETESTLARVDGIWFPIRIECWRGAGADRKAVRSIELIDLELNRAEHPPALTPRDIGLEPGMLIGRPNALATIWDGEREVSQKEFGARLRLGTVKEGPTVVAERARLLARRPEDNPPAAAPQSATRPSSQPSELVALAEWERHTLEFIRRHGLEADQAQRALVILRDCQDLARRLDHRDAAEVLRPSNRRLTAQASKRLADRINAIFEHQLLPRLDALLTTTQRKAAATTPAKPQTP